MAHSSSLAEKVFGQKRGPTPQWDVSSSLAERTTALSSLGKGGGQDDMNFSRSAAKVHPGFSVPDGIQTKQRSVRAQERLNHQRALYDKILKNPEEMSGEEIKKRALLAATSAQQKNLDDETLEDVFEKASRRLFLLWDQVGVEEDVRDHIRALALTNGATVQGLSVLHEEIQRLSAARAAEQTMAAAIESRESFLYLLMEAVELQASGEGKPKNIGHLINNIRISGFEIVESTMEWRKQLGYDAVYLWRGTSYLVKMASDLSFFASSPLVTRVQCAIMGNPMLNPARRAERLEGTSNPNEHHDGLPMLKLGGRAANKGPFGMLPPKKSAEVASSLLYTADRYMDCEATIRSEPDILRAYFQTRTIRSFDDPTIATLAEPDPGILKSLEDIKFVPEDIEEALADAAAASGEAKEMRMAAMKMQKWYRGLLGRRAAWDRREQVDAAKKIQGLYRYWAARRRALYLSKRKHAASKLQALTRGGAARARTLDSYMRNAAASKIQAVVRGHSDRKTFQLWKRVWACAVAIQRTYRSYASRQKTMAMKSKLHNNAAAEIQKIWRGGKLRVAGTADPVRVMAAIKIQKNFRGHLGRMYCVGMRMVHASAAKIQAVARGYLLRRQQEVLKFQEGPTPLK